MKTTTDTNICRFDDMHIFLKIVLILVVVDLAWSVLSLIRDRKAGAPINRVEFIKTTVRSLLVILFCLLELFHD